MCPACGGSRCPIIRMHSAKDAATHLVPLQRSTDRHAKLYAELRKLWDGDHVMIRACEECGFGFADPFRAGTPEIYNLITGCDEHYPRHRFEFRRTLPLLRGGRMLEVGAGDGAFLKRVQATGRFEQLVATEYDDGSVRKLRAIENVTVHQGDIQTLATETSPGSFDAICMFQVLEHMDRIQEVMAALDRLLTSGGDVFVSVPNPARTELQERETGFWDMPPNHIGRWTIRALSAAVKPVGLGVVDHEVDREPRIGALWLLAKYRLGARAYDPKTIAGRADGVSPRVLRGVVKRSLALGDAVVLALRLRGSPIPSMTQWFHLRRV